MIKKVAKKFVDKLSSYLVYQKKLMQNDQIAQRQLWHHYKYLRASDGQLPAFQETGFRVFSGTDEDGLLLYIFSMIGTTNKRCIELAYGTPVGANTTNLICNWGWHGLLIEADEDGIQESRKYFAKHKDTYLFPPKIIKSWITVENLNETISANGFQGEIDLFSLDVDGIDYWLWDSLTVVRPRVMVVEYQDIWGWEESVTVPYKPEFNRFDVHPDYFGASLAAFGKLAKNKGYRLIGCNNYGFNAFFLRDDVGIDVFPEITLRSCFLHPKTEEDIKTKQIELRNFEWQRV